MERDFAHMCPEVRALAEHMPDASQWVIFEIDHAATTCRARVALLGDAAHATTPHGGAGAGQAIENAPLLAELLADARVRTAADAAVALRAYDAVRQPRTRRVIAWSRENARLFCLDSKGLDAEDGDAVARLLRHRFAWLWDFDVVRQAEEACETMNEMLVAAALGKDDAPTL